MVHPQIQTSPTSQWWHLFRKKFYDLWFNTFFLLYLNAFYLKNYTPERRDALVEISAFLASYNRVGIKPVHLTINFKKCLCLCPSKLGVADPQLASGMRLFAQFHAALFTGPGSCTSNLII